MPALQEEIIEADLLDEAYGPDPRVTPAIRHRVRKALTQAHLAERVIEDTTLIVQELVTNVIDHARTPFRLVLRLCGAFVQVRVRDCSPRALEPRPFDLHAPRGRGLQLIAGMSQHWGCDRQPDGGKTVWATIAI